MLSAEDARRGTEDPILRVLQALHLNPWMEIPTHFTIPKLQSFNIFNGIDMPKHSHELKCNKQYSSFHIEDLSDKPNDPNYDKDQALENTKLWEFMGTVVAERINLCDPYVLLSNITPQWDRGRASMLFSQMCHELRKRTALPNCSGPYNYVCGGLGLAWTSDRDSLTFKLCDCHPAAKLREMKSHLNALDRKLHRLQAQVDCIGMAASRGWKGTPWPSDPWRPGYNCIGQYIGGDWRSDMPGMDTIGKNMRAAEQSMWLSMLRATGRKLPVSLR